MRWQNDRRRTQTIHKRILQECGTQTAYQRRMWLKQCTTEQLAEFLFIIGEDNWLTDISNRDKIMPHEKDVVDWLKQPHVD